jgi:glycosyltransferase involved in cell wall biosynthesis
MKIWIVFVGEELPIDGAVRAWRYGILSDILADRGHRVIRWAPTFYLHKFQRAQANTTVEVRDNFIIHLIYIKGYRRHISFERISHYKELAARYLQWAHREDVPDIILCGMPSPSMCTASVEYSRKNRIPILIDVRDLWPDIFMDVVPVFLKPLARLYLWPAFRRNTYIFRHTTGILGITDRFVKWGLDYGHRERCPYDATFTHAYREIKLDKDQVRQEEDFLQAAGVNFNHPIACFFGSFEESYDLETLIDAARIIYHRWGISLQFVLCGDGKKMSDLKKRANDLPNVFFLGRVKQPTVKTIMDISSIGLACYVRGATHTLSNKVIEYLCGGLAIVASKNEAIQAVIDSNQCGLTYKSHDPENLAMVLFSLMSRPEVLMSMKRNARLLYERDFAAEAVYGRMADHIEFVYKDFPKGKSK